MDVNLYAMIHNAMWRFEASGAYNSYSSIAEKRTSVRGKFNAKFLCE